MTVSNSEPGGAPDARFLRAIEAWCVRNGMSAGAFGAAVYGDRGFVAALRDGRSPRLRTVDRALAVMGEPPVGPAFLGEIEAFLAVTGMKRSLLGRDAAGNPSFVTQLLGGVSPMLATVAAVRASMQSHASPAEWREVRARAGAMPAILTGAPLASPEPPARPVHRGPEPEGAAGGDPDRCYMDTREASAWLGLAPNTLARYRITGEGPWYYRFGGCVRYRGDDLEAWAAGRRRSRGREAASQASP